MPRHRAMTEGDIPVVYSPPPSYETEIIGISEEQRNERQRRIDHTSRYAMALRFIIKKREDFGKKYVENQEYKYWSAYNAMCVLIKRLEGIQTCYELLELNLSEFKKQSEQEIQDSIDGELGQHRGMKEILVNLLFALATVGIGYAAAAFFKKSWTPIKCNTAASNCLMNAKSELNKIK